MFIQVCMFVHKHTLTSSSTLFGRQLTNHSDSGLGVAAVGKIPKSIIVSPKSCTSVSLPDPSL